MMTWTHEVSIYTKVTTARSTVNNVENEIYKNENDYIISFLFFSFSLVYVFIFSFSFFLLFAII